MNKIYRYISFESFIDLVIRKELTFVHPTLWDDPYELRYLYQEIQDKFIKSKKLETETLGAILKYIVANKLFAQSWTQLDESDALWRIYTHNGISIRIAVDIEKIKFLKDIKIIEVDYVDSYEDVVKNSKDFYGLVGTKRKAFSHEKEVRLVTHYKYIDTTDAVEHIKAFLALSGEREDFFKGIESGKTEEEINKLIEEVNRIIQKTNINITDKIKRISYEEVDDFIDSVMLSPFAPDWVDETLRVFCEQNNIKYLGKSNLYLYNE